MTDLARRIAVAPKGPASRAAGWPRGPYVQAALSYARRWPVRLAALWYAGFLLLFAWLIYDQQIRWSGASRDQARYQMAHNPVDPERGGVAAVAVTAVMAAFALPVLVALFGTAREQVTDWRGGLVPHYRRPHLTVLAVATAAVVVVTAGCLYAAAPFAVTALLAANLAIAALAGWCATLPPRGLGVLAVATVTLFSLRPVRVEYEAMLLHQDPTGAVLALIFTAVACAGVWVRLALVGESTAATKTGESLRLGQSLGFRRRMPGEHLGDMALRRRVALWRVPSSPAYLPAASAVGLLALIVGLCLAQPRDRAANAALAFPLAGLSVILPVMAVAAEWIRRLPAVGYELARPTTRRAFVRDVGLALAADLATWWAWLTAAGVAGITFALTYSHLLQGAPAVAVVSAAGLATFVAEVLLTSLAVQLLLYAALAWTLRFQTAWAVYLMTVAGVTATCAFFAYTLRRLPNWSPAATAAFLATLAILGLLLAADARRRWLGTDLR